MPKGTTLPQYALLDLYHFSAAPSARLCHFSFEGDSVRCCYWWDISEPDYSFSLRAS